MAVYSGTIKYNLKTIPSGIEVTEWKYPETKYIHHLTKCLVDCQKDIKLICNDEIIILPKGKYYFPFKLCTYSNFIINEGINDIKYMLYSVDDKIMNAYKIIDQYPGIFEELNTIFIIHGLIGMNDQFNVYKNYTPEIITQTSYEGNYIDHFSSMIQHNIVGNILEDQELDPLLINKSDYVIFTSPPIIYIDYKYENFLAIQNILLKKYNININLGNQCRETITEQISQDIIDDEINKINSAIDYLQELNLIEFIKGTNNHEPLN